MYIFAMIFLGKGFLKPQTMFNILNANAALIILSCGMSLVMLTGGIDISVGGVTALVSMSCAVYLDFHVLTNNDICLNFSHKLLQIVLATPYMQNLKRMRRIYTAVRWN